MKDVYLYERSTGRIASRVMGDDDAVDAMTSDTIGSVPYVVNTMSTTHKIDLDTLEVVEQP